MEASALRKIWLSVIASVGLILVFLKNASTSLSFRTIATASLSKISRIAYTCGKIILPVGSSISIVVINNTMSPYEIKSPTSEGVL